MRLTPLDIRKQEFTRGFRGYDPEEVHAFLQMVSSQWDDILDDSRRKDEKIRDLENKMAHYEKVEEALQEALLTARETSRKALQNAEDKARLIVDQAEKRAEDIKRDAEQDRHQIKRETAKLSGRRSEIVTRLRAFLMSEMELLARFEGDDPVGFIKLLPAEERRLHQFATDAQPETEVRTDERIESPASQPAGPDEPTTTFSPTPIEEPPHEKDAAEIAEPIAETADDESFYEGEETILGGEEDAPTATARSEPEPKPQEEVMQGPGWTARTVISRPSEQSASRSEEAPRYSEHSNESEAEEEEQDTRTRSSSDEIDKIRRILSDLD